MQTTTIEAEHKSEESKDKKTKAPAIYLAAAKVKESVIATLEKGLSHLDIEIIKEDDFEKGLKVAHMVVLLDENLPQLKKAWEAGVVTITSAFDSSITDYNPNTESGNSFVYKNTNEWEIFAAVVRALETYKFPYDWKFIIRSCKSSV
jgi:hypothetical protein